MGMDNQWREWFNYGVTKSLTAGVGTLFEEANIKIDSDANFEWQRINYFATNGNIRVKFRDESLGRYLVKTSADLRNIGSNFCGSPFIWGRPYIVMAGTNFVIDAADASTVANTLRFVLHGAKLRPGNPPWGNIDPRTGKIIWKRFKSVVPFVYSTGLNAIAASSTVSLRIEVDNDAHFLVQKITGSRHGNCLVEFKEGARDRDWQNTALPFDTMVGNGQFPNILYSQRFVYRGSVMIIQCQDLSALANSVEINLIGVKLYE